MDLFRRARVLSHPVAALEALPALGRPLANFRLVMVTVVLLVRVPFLFEPRWYSDEGIFTTVAWATSRGVKLYAGIFDNSPPGIYWLYRLLLLLGGGSNHVVVQAATTLAVVAAALLTHEIAVRAGVAPWPSTAAGFLTGLVLSVPTFDGDLLNTELAALPIFLAALAVAFLRPGWSPYAAGLLLGLALIIRPSFLISGAALLVPLLSGPEPVRRLALAAAGAATAGAVTAAALALQGSLGAFVWLVMPAEHAYLVWSNGGSLLPLLVRLSVLGVAAAGGLLAASTTRGRLLAVWLPASLTGASVTPREFTHYSHEAIPALALAIAIVVSRIPRRWLAAPLAAAALVAAIELVLVLPAQQTALMNSTTPPKPLLHNFPFQSLPGYYANWAEYVAGLKSRAGYEAYFPNLNRDQADVTFLRSHSPPEGAVLILGDSPWVYFKSGLLPASRYLVTNTAFWRVPAAPADLARNLGSGCAPVVVYRGGPGDWAPALASGGYVQIPGAPTPSYRSPDPGDPGTACP